MGVEQKTVLLKMMSAEFKYAPGKVRSFVRAFDQACLALLPKLIVNKKFIVPAAAPDLEHEGSDPEALSEYSAQPLPSGHKGAKPVKCDAERCMPKRVQKCMPKCMTPR